jgi:uncharacterized protein
MSPIRGQQIPFDAPLHTDNRPCIRAFGEATVLTRPDEAVVEIGVITEGPTPAATATQNARQTDAVLGDLRRVLNGGGQLRTTTYSVRPKYRYLVSGKVEISGYTATNVVQVTLDDMALLGKVIDAATQSGANLIQKLEYQLRNPGEVRAEALREAAGHAKKNVEAMAAGLGLKVARILSVDEVVPEFGQKKAAPPPPPPPSGTPPTTQIEVGMIEVAAYVSLRAEIGQ